MNLTWIRTIAVAALLAVVIGSLMHMRSSLIKQGIAHGAKEVQTAWDAQKLQALQRANADHMVKLRNSERNADEQATRQARTASRAASAAAADERLQRAVDALNARDRDAAQSDPGAAALVVKATVARGLLGNCATAYREVAAAAAELRDQVNGLLFDATHVCRP